MLYHGERISLILSPWYSRLVAKVFRLLWVMEHLVTRGVGGLGMDTPWNLSDCRTLVTAMPWTW